MMDDHFNYINELIQNATKGMMEKKEALVMQKIKAIDPKFDPEHERKRRFKTILCESHDNGKQEIYYYNDGSDEGIRIITFIEKPMEFSKNPEDYTFNMGWNFY